MEMETLLGLAVALSAGLIMSRVVKPFKLPAVTGYLIAGIVFGLAVLVVFVIQPDYAESYALDLWQESTLNNYSHIFE